MRFPLSTDLCAGFIFMGIGASFVLTSRQYEYGSAAEMGPGFFPVWLGGLLILLGTGLLFRSAWAGNERETSTFPIRQAALVLVALLIFALLLEKIGLVLAALLLLGVASQAAGGFRLVQLGVFMAGLIAFVTLIFVYLLRVSIKLWPLSGS